MPNILIRTPLKDTENIQKVKQAILNIISSALFEVEKSDEMHYLNAESKELSALSPLHKKLREQKTLETARTILKKNSHGNSVTFCLNKQAAYAGHIHFCQPERESPLGPIVVKVTYEKLDLLIDWLAPHTIKGKPVGEISLE